MKRIKLICTVVAMLLYSINTFAQSDTITKTDSLLVPKKKVRNGFGFIPNKKTRKINGLAIGPVLNPYDSIIVNGLNIEILGLGFNAPVPITYIPFSDRDSIDKVFLDKQSQKINGVSLSLLGHFNTAKTNGILGAVVLNRSVRVNGIAIGILGNRIIYFNGVEFAIFINQTSKGRGLQVGLFNTCYDLRGIQIGLWNKNGKRSLPFINWQFTP